MRAPQVSIGKITPPELPEVVLRRHLFELLDDKRHYRVTWISSLAGSGKTTLIASYLYNSNIPCLWYQLDKGDDDIATFFYYLGIAAAKIAPQNRELMPTFTPQYLPGVSMFARRFFENLCCQLVAPFYIVFDNYHEIPPESSFHEVFKSGLAGISPDIHVIILSRTTPPQAFAGLFANKVIRIIGPKKLTLSLEESRELIQIETGEKLPPDVMKHVYEKTRGWAAGLVLMGSSVEKGNIHSFPAEEFIPESIFGYFASELFDKMNENFKDFLLKTAFLPRMTVSIARRLTGMNDASKILSFLNSNHLFTGTFPAPVREYEYHPLFREFLKSKANNRFHQEEVRLLKEKSAILLQAAGHFEDAVELFSESEDYENLITVVLDQATQLVSQGRHKTLEQWILKIPEEIVQKEPWLLYWLGVSCLHLIASDARKYLEKALKLFKLQDDITGLCLAWASIIESITFEWNDFTELDPWLDWFDKHILPSLTFPSAEIEVRVSLSRLSGLIIRRPNHPDLPLLLEETLTKSREIGNVALYMQTVSWALTYYAWIGDFAKTDVIYKESQKLARSLKGSPPMVIHRKWLEISIAICNMTEIDSALDKISDALALIKEMGLYFWEHLFLMPAIFISFVSGDLSAAETLLNRFQAILHIKHYHIFSIYHHFRSLYNLHTGNIVQAKAEAESAVKVGDETGYLLPALICRFQLSYALFELGQIEKSKKEIYEVHDAATSLKSRILEFMSLLLMAKIELERGDERKGLHLLDKAMSLGQRQGLFTMAWWWYSPAIARLCAKALAENFEPEYVKRFIRLNRLPPCSVESFDLENWPWALRIRSLDTFQILKDDQPISFTRKAQKMPLKLLKVLVAHGGTEVHMDKIIDALWYDTDGDMANNAFSTTLNRLRKLIGTKDIISLKDGKLTLDSNYCELDIWTFEQALEKAKRLMNQGLKREAISLYKKAINTYKSHFLASEPEEPWMIPMRERLKTKFTAAIRTAAEFFEENNAPEDALSYYEKGLDVDPLQEIFYQRMMLLYQKLGFKVEALKVYKRCEETLKRMLETEPSHETSTIYRQIIESD
ncbi:MAG: hypothetical protein DRG83_02555 [Deltaproteobacteria bacterium]|nr:MAG: hypothetical protein DRG83_02555 [Deltaproteobacteria bacterium]